MLQRMKCFDGAKRLLGRHPGVKIIKQRQKPHPRFGIYGGAKFGCEVVSSTIWCEWNKPEYHFLLQTTSRFRGVAVTVRGTYPCAQGVSARFVPLDLPYVLRSSRAAWVEENGDPIRDAELLFKVSGELLLPSKEQIRVFTDHDGVADVTEVFRRIPWADVTLNDGHSKRTFVLKMKGPGDAGRQTVRVMMWRYLKFGEWVAEVSD